MNYYIDELARRRQDRMTAVVVRLTKVLVRRTWTIAGLGLIAVVFAIRTYFKA